jgi:hypothetical protein
MPSSRLDQPNRPGTVSTPNNQTDNSHASQLLFSCQRPQKKQHVDQDAHGRVVALRGWLRTCWQHQRGHKVHMAEGSPALMTPRIRQRLSLPLKFQRTRTELPAARSTPKLARKAAHAVDANRRQTMRINKSWRPK